jgi:hypothetical protein
VPVFAAAVGIDAYPTGTAATLRGAADGAAASANVLGLPADARALLCRAGHGELPPTRSTIEAAILELLTSATHAPGGPHDLVIALAGHGYEIKNQPHLYTGSGPPDDAEHLLSVATVALAAAAQPLFRRVLVMADCCRQPWSSGPTPQPLPALGGTTPWLLLATDARSLAWNASDGPTLGYFTEAVLEGVAGAASPVDGGGITLRRLLDWVVARVLWLTQGRQEVDLGFDLPEAHLDELIAPADPEWPTGPALLAEAFFDAMLHQPRTAGAPDHRLAVRELRAAALAAAASSAPPVATTARIKLSWIPKEAAAPNVEVFDEDGTLVTTVTPAAQGSTLQVPTGVIRVRPNHNDAEARSLLVQPGAGAVSVVLMLRSLV